MSGGNFPFPLTNHDSPNKQGHKGVLRSGKGSVVAKKVGAKNAKAAKKADAKDSHYKAAIMRRMKKKHGKPATGNPDNTNSMVNGQRTAGKWSGM